MAAAPWPWAPSKVLKAYLTFMDPSSSSPGLSIAITVLAVLLVLTGFGVYTAFGPPSRGLTDPFDDHDD